MKSQTLVDPNPSAAYLYQCKRFISYTVLYSMELLHDLKIIYHCFSCKKDIVDIDLAKEHSKSLHHELVEETKRASDDDQP